MFVPVCKESRIKYKYSIIKTFTVINTESWIDHWKNTIKHTFFSHHSYIEVSAYTNTLQSLRTENVFVPTITLFYSFVVIADRDD